MSTGKESKYLFEDFRIDIDPDKIDESVKALQERLKRMVDQGRYTKVRLKYKGKALMPDIPLGIFMATEAASFWYAGLFRAPSSSRIFSSALASFVRTCRLPTNVPIGPPRRK